MATSDCKPSVAAAPVCWCGEKVLQPYSPEYLACESCGCLVSRIKATVVEAGVQDDNSDFYGKDYWLGHQVEGLGLPDIRRRARADLPERCIYWVRNLLAHKPPPARTLEVGCSHGGFVSLLQSAGYNASGLEVSPWVVDFARRTFNVPVQCGPIEEQRFAEHSFDAIILNDVVEHLPDPEGTLNHCGRLLKDDGVLVVQMPERTEGVSFEDLVARNDPSLPLMQGMAREHLHLFSRRAARQLLDGLGFAAVEFLTPKFPYDMYLMASRQPLVRHEDEAVAAALARTAGGRLIQAMLDLDGQITATEQRLLVCEYDRAARLEVINRIGEEMTRAAQSSLRARLRAAPAAAVGQVRALPQLALQGVHRFLGGVKRLRRPS